MTTLKAAIFSSFKLGGIGFFLLVASINSYAHDSDRIKKLEQDVQELRTRLNNLEVNKSSASNNQSFIISGDGWQSISNWRKLQTGMSPAQVRDILGEPQRVRGGGMAIWDYQNDGSVTFLRERLNMWSEPK